MQAEDLIPNFAIIGNCRLGNEQGRHSLERPSWEGVKSIPRCTTYHGTVDGRKTPVQGLLFVWGSFITDHPPGPTKSPFMTCRVRGAYYYPDPPRYPFTRPPSRSRVYFCPFRELHITCRGQMEQLDIGTWMRSDDRHSRFWPEAKPRPTKMLERKYCTNYNQPFHGACISLSSAYTNNLRCVDLLFQTWTFKSHL